MKFYCLIASQSQQENKSYTYLKQACEARGIEFVPLFADSFDYTQDTQNLLEAPSIFYRLGTGKRTMLLEMLLVRPGVTTFYDDGRQQFMRGTWAPTIVQQKAGLPIVPTIYNVDRSQDDHFAAYATYLGGFPLILKASGGSHGGSVLRVDSLESLRSVVGYVGADTQATFALRKYIHDATHVRFVVVGDQVVDAIRYLPQAGDFRTNAVAVPQVESYLRTDENADQFELAVRTVKAENLDFGGVDILIGGQGRAYVAELNFPCNFSRNQMNTGVDVAGAMVDYLMAKAER